MDEPDSIEVYYPAGMQLVLLIGVPCLGLISLWMLTRPPWEDGVSGGQVLAGWALGSATAYHTFIGWRVLHYIRCKVLLWPDRLEVVFPGRRRAYAPEQLLPPEQYAFAASIRFRLQTGEEVLFASTSKKNVHVLVQYNLLYSDEEA